MERHIHFLRIDDRLIHGQVLAGWLPVLKSSFLVVANEKVAGDPVRQDMMGLAMPPEVTLLFQKPGENSGSFTEETLLLVASPKDAWLCLQSGCVPARLNVGGMHAKPGKEEVREALHLDNEDRDYFRKIMESGVMPEFQPTPQNDPVPLNEIL